MSHLILKEGIAMEDLINYLLTPSLHIALIIGLAEIIKRLGLDTRFIPLIDLALGLISGIFVFGLYLNYGVVIGVIIGIAEGLSACGLFSGVKNLTQNTERGGNNE